MKAHVTKYHGCGNDFILVQPQWIREIPELTAFIVSVCDRHTGIGADGFIIARTDPLEMEYYNQDGSRAPMCGNGIRCFSRFCLDQGLAAETPFWVQTLAGPYLIEREKDLFQVQMGTPREDLELLGLDSPVKHETIAGLDVSALFMGTIHAVVYTEDAFGEIEQSGKAVCTHPRFRLQTNVNFVQVLDPGHMRVQTYERGCGVTLACGTGVCASVVQAIRDGLCKSPVQVDMKAGSLLVTVDPETEAVTMTGPARKILEGEFHYDQTA